MKKAIKVIEYFENEFGLELSHNQKIDLEKILNKKDKSFWVECNVCKQKLKNWTGSTPCCGSIAYLIEDGEPTTKIKLFASVGGKPIKPTVVDLGKK